MPRYRFRWELVPPRVLRELTHGLALRGDPVEALRRRYGLRPKSDFVRENWPILRDRWLARDGVWRRFVVQELRDLGLGKLDADVRTKAQQMDYLASCRNAESLRMVVLAAFHQLGDIGRVDAPARPSDGVAAAVPEVADKVWRDDEPIFADLDQTLAQAWSDFEGRLSRALARLEDGQALILEVPSPYDRSDLEGAAPYVEFGATAGGTVHGNIPSSEALDERHHLTAEVEGRLREIGWSVAEDETTENPMFSLVVSRAEVQELARASVAAIREVFGVPHPSFLTALGFSTEENVVVPGADLGVAGIAQRLPDDRSNFAVTPASPDHLIELVDAVLTTLFGRPPVRDDDGDIAIRSGSAMVFVRVLPDAPIVELFAPLLVDVEGTALTLERIAQINLRVRFVKFTWRSGAVYADMQLHCLPFVGSQLRHAVALMSEVADRSDDELRVQLGGRLFFDDEQAAGAADDGFPPELLTLLHLDPNGTGDVTPELAADICHHDLDLILDFIRQAEEQTISWRQSAERAEVGADDDDEAAVCHGEERAWQQTVDLLRAALRVVVGG